MTRALIIGAEERARIAELAALAATLPIDARRVMEMPDDEVRDMMEALSIELPIGFHVTYSQETQHGQLLHHLSVSVENNKGMLPHPDAVEMILRSFGMQPLEARTSNVWIETFDGGKAINVLQPVHPPDGSQNPTAPLSK